MLTTSSPNTRVIGRSRSAQAVFVFALTLLLGSITPSIAQVSSSATLRGTVTDQAGAIVPEATVTLINEKTGTVDRSIKTSDEGIFVFPSINPDVYTLRVEAPNFQTTNLTGITVNPSATRSEDVTLQVGGGENTVDIAASAVEEVKTETSEKSNTITAKQIENLSLIGRSSLELLRVLPGVVAPDQEDLQSIGFNTGANATGSYNVNGLRGVSNNVSIDGSRTVDIGSNNGTIITANNDMVQEVEVKTSNYMAEYGSAGVQISAVTKGGGRDFHGSLYDYVRDRRLQARDRSRSIAGLPRANSQFQYPGGNLSGPVTIPNFGEGGPVVRKFDNRLFFFFGLEFQRQRVDPGTFLSQVPTLLERQGDFSQSGTVNAPRGLGSLVNGDLRPYADPTGRVLLNLFPLPNFNDPQGRFNYAASALQPVNRVDAKVRFDYKVSDNANLYLRLARESENQDSAYGLWWQQSNYELPSHVQGTNLGRSAALGFTNSFGSTMTNEVVFSYSKLQLDNDYADPEKVSRAALGLDNFRLPFGVQSPYAPLSIITSWNGNSSAREPGDFSTTNPQVFANNDSLSITDNFTKLAGSHTLKFGGTFERADKNQNFENPTDGRLITATWGAGSTGNEFADIYAGQPAQFAQGTRTEIGDFRFYNVEAYAQDRWKLRPNFTLEYGVRIGYFPNNVERKGLGGIFDPRAYNPAFGPYINGDPTRPNGILFASRGEVPKGLVPNEAPQVMPRLGFAWDVRGTSDLVIRGGGGLFYNRVQGNYQYDVLRLPPNSYAITLDAGDSRIPAGTPGCESFLCRVGQVNPFTFLGGFDVNTNSLVSNSIPRVANFSLSIAKRLPFKNVLEVAYVGTIGRHLPQRRQTNVLPPLLSGTIGNADLSNPLHRAALSADAVTALNAFRPYPSLGNVRVAEYTGTSSYNSLQATLSRQLSSNFTYFATYTFSKALGTVAVGETGQELDPVDARGRNYGILPYDRTHIFNLSYNYTLPNGARKGFDNVVTRAALNGWQVSGITTLQSGRPIYPRLTGAIVTGDVRRSFFGTDAASGVTAGIGPIYLRSPQLGGSRLGDRLLDPGAFAAPAFGQAGSFQPPFYMRSPGRSNFDISFFKNFRIGEDGTKVLQFRSGFFNIFNQAFSNPDLGDVNFNLNTTCNAFVPEGTPTGTGVAGPGGTVGGTARCDPTRGFTIEPGDFGRITTLRGRRIVELALKFNF